MGKKREISPAVNATPDEYLALMPLAIQGVISTIRAEKDEGSRKVPSTSLIDRSSLLTPQKRSALLDYVAALVDENLTGRSDMCAQFALLIALALTHLNINCRAVAGEAIYYSDTDEEIFRWDHAWVRAGSEVIDGNIDSVTENPLASAAICMNPYWGPIKGIPARWLIEHGEPEEDTDVLTIWWPDLKNWLDEVFHTI